MKEIITKITSETGISNEQAQKALDVIINYIKEKLPPMLHTAVDNFIQNDDTSKEIDPLD